MIDIGRIFKSGDKPAAETPVQLAAIAVEKREDMGPVREAIAKAGFSVEQEVEREDGVILFNHRV